MMSTERFRAPRRYNERDHAADHLSGPRRGRRRGPRSARALCPRGASRTGGALRARARRLVAARRRCRRRDDLDPRGVGGRGAGGRAARRRVAPAAPGGPHSRLDVHGERPADRRADAGGRRTARALPVAADRLGVDPGAGDPPGAPGAVHPPRNRTLAGAADGPAARPGAGADRQRPDLAAQLRALPDGAPRACAPCSRRSRWRWRARPTTPGGIGRSACPPPGCVSRGISSTPAGSGGDPAGERRQAAIRERLARRFRAHGARRGQRARPRERPRARGLSPPARRRTGPAAGACPAPPGALRRGKAERLVGFLGALERGAAGD